MNSKKAAIVPIWVPGLVIVTFLVLIACVIYLNQKIESVSVVGEAQQQVFEAAAVTENALVYLDTSANLAAQQAAFTLDYSGGYYIKQGCGMYLGFNMWTTSESQCFPESGDLVTNFKQYFSSELGRHLSAYTLIRLSGSYKFSITENPFIIAGSAMQNINVEIPTAVPVSGAPAPSAPATSGVSVPSTPVAIYDVPVIEYTPTQSELKTKIIAAAKKTDIPANIALAVAFTESSISHTDKTGKVKCSGPANSRDCGVMQINSKAHPGCYDITKPRGICSVPECEGKTIYDIDCNIAAGVNYLGQLYKTAKKKVPYVYCRATVSEKTYTDPWDIALRLYNGPGGCGTILANYVEKVRTNEIAFA